MKTWTNQAEKRLADYLEERVRREGFDGEDADELKSDLRRHIHEEAEKESGEGIGSMQLEGILGRLDAGYRESPRSYEVFPPEPYRMSGIRPFWAWTWGVVMPAGVSIFEIISSFCGGVFFDPVATWWHAVLILSVPLVNAWILKGAPRGSERTRGLAAGFALVIALFYALLFLPLLPASIIAVIFVVVNFDAGIATRFQNVGRQRRVARTLEHRGDIAATRARSKSCDPCFAITSDEFERVV